MLEYIIMKYMGSKRRIAKYILPIMLKNRGGRAWVEPFVGGGNIIELVSGKRIGADVNPRVISALAIVRDRAEYLPKNSQEFTEDDYTSLRESDDCWFKDYAGFAYSYGGKWMGGWRRDKIGKRDYINEAYRAAIKQSKSLQGVQLICASYDRLTIPEGSLIYCDPPYKDATKYKTEDFDHGRFWSWCRTRVSQGCVVFVSEYEAPRDFSCVWEKEIPSSLTKDTGAKKGVERLFTLAST